MGQETAGRHRVLGVGLVVLQALSSDEEASLSLSNDLINYRGEGKQQAWGEEKMWP